jgi:hypothetical protein
MVLAESSGGSAGRRISASSRRRGGQGLVNWPQLTKNDYELFGEFIEVYSFIDFQFAPLHGSAGF